MANLKCILYFQYDSNVCSDVTVILLVFHAGDPGSIAAEGNIFRLQSYLSQFLYILQQDFSSVLHKT